VSSKSAGAGRRSGLASVGAVKPANVYAVDVVHGMGGIGMQAVDVVRWDESSTVQYSKRDLYGRVLAAGRS